MVRWPGQYFDHTGSSRSTLVEMVQTPDLWAGDNGAGRGRLYGPRLGAAVTTTNMSTAASAEKS